MIHSVIVLTIAFISYNYYGNNCATTLHISSWYLTDTSPSMIDYDWISENIFETISSFKIKEQFECRTLL